MTRALAVALWLMAPAWASAQSCAEGRERVEGRCCWPGQSWSETDGRCRGAPHCPEALVEHGDECVAPIASAPAPSAWGPLPPPEATPAVPLEWPDRDEAGARSLSHVVMAPSEDEGLLIGAFLLFDLAWWMGVVGGVLDEQANQCDAGFFTGRSRVPTSCRSVGFAPIPIVGGLLAPLLNFGPGLRTNASFLALGIPSLILQIAGVVAIGVAFANGTIEPRYQPLGSPATVALVPAASGADAGLSLDLRF